MKLENKKIFIFGAGASRGAQYTHPIYKPPLLKDLHEILYFFEKMEHPRRLNTTQFYNYHITAKELSDSENDIEKMFTDLLLIDLLFREVNIAAVSPNDIEIKNIISNRSLIEKYFGFHEERIEKMKMLIKASSGVFSNPKNFTTFFTKYLNDYLNLSIYNSYCDYHASLFKYIEFNDTVISFNYDQILDFTLNSLGHLDHKSFESLNFESVRFPSHSKPKIPIKFLKMHGSLNWYQDIYNHSLIHYFLVSEAEPLPESPDGSPFTIILPHHLKNIFYQTNRVFKAHIESFKISLQEAEIIFLVGKSFMNSDNELNNLIIESCSSKKKALYIIDPSEKDSKFTDYHKNLFNAEIYDTRKTIFQHYLEPFSLVK